MGVGFGWFCQSEHLEYRTRCICPLVDAWYRVVALRALDAAKFSGSQLLDLGGVRLCDGVRFVFLYSINHRHQGRGHVRIDVRLHRFWTVAIFPLSTGSSFTITRRYLESIQTDLEPFMNIWNGGHADEHVCLKYFGDWMAEMIIRKNDL